MKFNTPPYHYHNVYVLYVYLGSSFCVVAVAHLHSVHCTFGLELCDIVMYTTHQYHCSPAPCRSSPPAQVQALAQQPTVGNDAPANAPTPSPAPPADLAHAALTIITPVQSVLAASHPAVQEAACVAVGCIAAWLGRAHGEALQSLLPTVMELARGGEGASVRAAALAALAACTRCAQEMCGCVGRVGLW